MGSTPPLEQRFVDLQSRIKVSLDAMYKDFLKHDWREDGHTFPLMKYYTNLSWVRTVKDAMGKVKEPMESIDDLLKVPGAGEQCIKILIEAGSGMGKSSSMAYLAMKWVKDKTGDFPFDFVFLIPLRNVNENCSLAELIADEYDLEKEDIETVGSILTGKTKHKALLLLDGYDEYTRGTNRELDEAVEKTKGTYFIILTSRPKEGRDFTEKIRKKMTREVVIEGFSRENIKKCCSQYFGSEQEARFFLDEAKKKADIYELLTVPIILLITSVLYKEDDRNEGKPKLDQADKKSLPDRRTELYEDLYEFLMDRSTLKSNNFGCYSSDIPNLKYMLQILGKFAWDALQKNDKQLLIEKEDLESKCPDIMKLGLLHEVGVRKARKQPAYLSYEHKSLQEFGASNFVTERLETSENIKETLNELFPSWEAVQRYREVVIFITGLMKDPTPLVEHTYEMRIGNYLREMRTGGLPSIDRDLFKSLYSECAVPLPDHPLHNKFINYYDHNDDDHMKRPKNTTPVYFPSRVYLFWRIQKVPALCDINVEAEIPECAMIIYSPDKAVTESLLSLCRMISKHQPVTDLFMLRVYSDGMTATEAPRLSKSMQSLTLTVSTLPTSFVRDILQQLHGCVTLRLLFLYSIDLREVEEDLDRLLGNIVCNHERGLSQTILVLSLSGTKLSEEFQKKWNERCENIPSIDCKIT